MILTVTPNAAVDTTYRVEGFCLDRVHRPTEWKTVAGGKGVNVARVYSRLGGEATATGLLAGHNGRLILESLASEQIPAEFTWTAGESRICLAIVDPIACTQTEINEPGPPAAPDDVESLCDRVRSLLETGRFWALALCGSLPPGAPATLYRDLVELAGEQGVRAALDASGEPLREGVKAGPWLAKPNAREAGDLLGRTPAGDGEKLDAAWRLLEMGVSVAVVTDGPRPAVLVTGEEAWSARPPEVEFVSAVGSGDAFLAGLLLGMEQGRGMKDSLALATAAGAANAAVYGAGFVAAAEVHRLTEFVEVQSIGGR